MKRYNNTVSLHKVIDGFINYSFPHVLPFRYLILTMKLFMNLISLRNYIKAHKCILAHIKLN